MIAEPTLDFERSLFESGARRIIACDEVGRGALAGPVAVGMVVIDVGIGPIPAGLRDSKMVPEPRRESLAPVCRQWVRFSAVGLASAAQIDELGIIACLGIAGRRALEALFAQGEPIDGSTIILDGNHDYLTPALAAAPAVLTRVKADRDCASVSAASVIAKVFRDRLMIRRDAEYPGYGWVENKGYGSAGHLDAIGRLGASDFHRRSWLKSPGFREAAYN